MTSVVIRSAIAPLFTQPGLRCEQGSQMVMGETGGLLESSAEWRRVRGDLDGYEGWIHAGYLLEMDDAAAAAWRKEAVGWSLGAAATIGRIDLPLPLRARVVLEDSSVRLPDGRSGRLAAGAVAPASELCLAARGEPAERWALEHFAGAPYEWGGVTPWGVDCSGLVQTTFAARGSSLPRDSALQARQGVAVAFDAIRPGDLLFFRSEAGEAITHVAFAAEGDTLIHSTLSCGGVVQESWLPGTRAASLRERLVAVRRV